MPTHALQRGSCDDTCMHHTIRSWPQHSTSQANTIFHTPSETAMLCCGSGSMSAGSAACSCARLLLEVEVGIAGHARCFKFQSPSGVPPMPYMRSAAAPALATSMAAATSPSEMSLMRHPVSLHNYTTVTIIDYQRKAAYRERRSRKRKSSPALLDDLRMAGAVQNDHRHLPDRLACARRAHIITRRRFQKSWRLRTARQTEAQRAHPGPRRPRGCCWLCSC